MANTQHLLATFIVCCAVPLCFSNCRAQDFNPRLPELPKWNLDGFKQIPTRPELFKTTPEIIVMRGYPSEIHHVVTKDGYILELHRIPAKSRNSRVVYIQHGVFQSSNEWVLSSSDRSLAFQLSDLGFDVWLGNVRGNSYSTNHITLNPADLQFWNFGWDEVGDYDIPAIIEYILEITGQTKLISVTHSLGAAWLFIAAINHPELNDKIEMAITLAPFASSVYYRPRYPLVTNNIDIVKLIMRLLKLGQVFRASPLVLRQINNLCGKMHYQARFCNYLISLATGPNPDNLDLELLPVLLSVYFSGTSANTMIQFFQNPDLGFGLNAFDYGPEENRIRYGTETPKSYDLSQVTMPVHIFWSQGDYIANPQDVEWLASSLGNLKTYNQVLNSKYNHIDFLFGNDVNEMVYQPVLSLIHSAGATKAVDTDLSAMG